MNESSWGFVVRIVNTPDTVAAGYADRTGNCYGWTTPSVTGVSVIGPAEGDYALGVTFDDGTTAWFPTSLVVEIDSRPEP